MSKNPKTLNVKTALQRRKNRFPLSKNHITTASFFQFNPTYCIDLIPKSSIRLNMDAFARLNPMPSPTFGFATIKNRFFFVPFRTLFPGWNDFITDTLHTDANGSTIYPTVPVVSNKVLLDFLSSSVCSTSVLSTASYDFVVYNNTVTPATTDYRAFTTFGRWVYKVLRSLGYSLIFRYDSKTNLITCSALRLLALARVYTDYYANSAYLNNATAYQAVAKLFAYDVNNLSLTTTDLSSIFTLCQYVNYDTDYFTGAFDRPQGPANIGSFKAFSDVNRFSATGSNVQGSMVSDNTAGNLDQVPAIVPENSLTKPGQITQYIIDSLHALTDYMMRHQYVGARAVDRYLARFGVKLSDEKLNRSIYIDTHLTPLKIGDVVSTADTQYAQLGGYAGKGVFAGGDDKTIKFETDEYGVFLCVSTIIPQIGYYQGLDRAVIRKDRFEFFTPEFDALGTQPILARELYDSRDGSNAINGGIHTQIFGFTPRYADYKIALDQLTGDFVLPSVNAGKSSWHLLRQFNDLSFQNDHTKVVHSRQFCIAEDAEQYNRIFYTTGDKQDKMNVIYNFDVDVYAPMKPMYDTYDYHSEGTDIKMDINGNHIN